jgi:hypothetical protein
VLLLIGRCLYELVDYARAAEAFEAARAADPLNLEVRSAYCHALVGSCGTFNACGARHVHEARYAVSLKPNTLGLAHALLRQRG